MAGRPHAAAHARHALLLRSRRTRPRSGPWGSAPPRDGRGGAAQRGASVLVVWARAERYGVRGSLEEVVMGVAAVMGVPAVWVCLL